MGRDLAALRSQIESALAGRVPAPFTFRDRQTAETVPTRIPVLDGLIGGLPRGCLTEICGPSCSGRTSLLLAALATRTAEAEVCALVDGRDGFDPQSAEAAGVSLDRLLWVRCQNIQQSLRATDLLLQGGGFGLIALDLTDIPAKTVRYVPLNVWFRFRRSVENTPTILLVLDQESNASTCASLVLRLQGEKANWMAAPPMPSRGVVHVPGHPPFARLLEGSHISAERLRSRRQPFARSPDGKGCSAAKMDSDAVNFATRTMWNRSQAGYGKSPADCHSERSEARSWRPGRCSGESLLV